MNRRRFLGSGAAGLSLPGAGYAAEFADQKPKRVGLIGAGWYGKMRPVPAHPGGARRGGLALRRRQEDAGRGRRDVATRQASKKKPRTYGDYREMLKEKDLDIVLIATPDHWHALAMIAAVEAGADVYVAEADQRGRDRGPGHAGRGAQASAGGPGGHPAAQHAPPDRGPRPDRPRGQARQDRPGRNLLLLPHAARGNPPDTNPPDYLDYEMWTGPAPMRPYNR